MRVSVCERVYLHISVDYPITFFKIPFLKYLDYQKEFYQMNYTICFLACGLRCDN